MTEGVAIPDHLLPTRLVRAETGRAARFQEVLPGTTREMVLSPDYWVHLAGSLKVHDRIEIVTADGTLDIEVRVVAVDTRGFWAQVRLLRDTPDDSGVKLPVAKAWPDADGYSIEWGRAHQWRILDRALNIVAKNLPSEAIAMEALSLIKREKVAA